MARRAAWLALAAALGCGGESRDEPAPAIAARAEGAAQAALPAHASAASKAPEAPLPPRGTSRLSVADGRVSVAAFAAPRQPLLEQLASVVGFRLELGDAPLTPLTLQIEDQPLELALPLLVGDLEYQAEWTSEEGAHRLALLRVGGARKPAPSSDDGGLRTGEVHTSLERELEAQRQAPLAPRSRSEIERDLASSDPELRVRAALSLESEGRDLERLGSLLESDPDPRVRAAATVGLEDAEDFAGLDALLGGLDDPNPEVVVEVLDSIEYAGDESVVPRLRPLLAHSDPRVREAAANAIATLE